MVPRPRLAQARPQPGHAAQVNHLAFTANGKELVSIAADGSLCRWEAESLRELARSELPEDYRVHGLRRRGDSLLLRMQARAARW